MSDIDAFRAQTRAWLLANCPPSMRTPIVPDEMVWAGTQLRFQSEDQQAWFERMRDKRWFAPDWPREWGGAGLSRQETRVLDDEMRALGCRAPQYNLGVWMLAPVLLALGSEAQKREHLIPMALGQQRWVQGFSEPNAGSDLASLKTSAVLVGDEFLVNGSKIWTSDGDKGDWMYALVRTDTTVKKQLGISFLMIDMRLPGITVKPIELISGKSGFCQVFFDDVRVPQRQLVGEINAGWSVAKQVLAHERAAMSKFSEGAAPSADVLSILKPLLHARAGQASAAVLREQLARQLMDEQAFALTHRRVTEEALARLDVSGAAAIMKLVQTEQEVAKYELLMQALGGDALTWHSEGDGDAQHQAITRAWLRSKTYTIAGGSSEIQLNLIARRVLDLPEGAK